MYIAINYSVVSLFTIYVPLKSFSLIIYGDVYPIAAKKLRDPHPVAFLGVQYLVEIPESLQLSVYHPCDSACSTLQVN
jgi:hypothetical protein